MLSITTRYCKGSEIGSKDGTELMEIVLMYVATLRNSRASHLEV